MDCELGYTEGHKSRAMKQWSPPLFFWGGGGNEPQPLLWVGSWAARVKIAIIDIPNLRNYFFDLMVCRNCLLKHVIEGKIDGTGRRRRRRKQLLDYVKETRGD